jgi:PAS domain S-box-containing protein
VSQDTGLLDPIITMNSGGVIQSASDSVEQVFGWTPSELFGRNVNMLIPEPRRSALDKYLDRYRYADKAKVLQRTRRFEAVRKDGRSIQIELSMSRADIPSGGSPYFIGIVRDMSQVIDVGGTSPHERSRLQHLVTEQTRALATANLRLQLADRLASLGTLAAGLGHDMNNVLLPVRARLNALESAGINSAAITHVKAVRRSVAYLQHLSDGLHFLSVDPNGLGVADVTNAATHLHRWWIQVGMLLRKVVPAHVKVAARFSKRLPALRIAPHWLTQAMLNLIVNAGESIPTQRRDGRVTLSASLADDGHAVLVNVTDNGRGMTAGVQRRAMDLFFTTKSRGMGTGLGLPLAHNVADRAGGRLTISSRPRRGTTVVLSLPVASASVAGAFQAANANSASPRAEVTLRNHRIAALVANVLASAGVTVIAASRGGPRSGDIWVTDPTSAALIKAKQWSKQHSRCIVLLGAPSAKSRKAWAAFEPLVIDPPDDFVSIRHVIALALECIAKAKSGGSNDEEPSKQRSDKPEAVIASRGGRNGKRSVT